ncbi:DUF2334 domain-containing protein [Puniceicoccus vermicola]|uniref:Polysaccharide deacetylase family protein n=1 Tax=Puniceicoccus vermicola TaxID=388746 RepID=A0A7X1AVM8_9BACT|nr:polysaccharide deacetylase family protein [Puniceicoccus vermicola]MBC2600792.1 polysaccharide deacetylase family protein [Puniceicoccus vermicola]
MMKNLGADPIVVIKADDLVCHSNGTVFGSQWDRFFELAADEGIKVSAGIIGKSLQQGTPEYFDQIRALEESGQVEFWNHGYTHGRDSETGESEFKGPDFETQLETLVRTQDLASEKLGFTLHSFGSPFNANDANTVEAIRATPEIMSWLYGSKDAELLPGQVALIRFIDIEQPVHHPNYEAFKSDYLEKPDIPYYVLQVHPGGWDSERLDQFRQVVNFLQEQNAEFLTPSELKERLLSKE